MTEPKVSSTSEQQSSPRLFVGRQAPNPDGCGVQRRKKGSGLVAAVALVTLASMLVLSYLAMGLDQVNQMSSHGRDFRLGNAGEGAISLAVGNLWTEHNSGLLGESPTAQTIKDFLSSKGIEDAGFGGRPGFEEGVDILALINPSGDMSGEVRMAGAIVESLMIVRRDTSTGTTLFLTAKLRPQSLLFSGKGGGVKIIQHAFAVEGGYWNGLDFALMANNINCVMCHATIDSADRFYNADPTAYGSSSRVRVGVLESIQLRSGNGSTINGTLYVRGKATDRSGTPITDWSKSGLQSVELDSSGLIVEDNWGEPTNEDLSPAGDARFGNLYLDYGREDTQMVDGFMPVEFPPVVPDDGGIDPDTGEPDLAGVGNRKIDEAEYLAKAADASGSLAGGSIYHVPGGERLDSYIEYTAAEAGNLSSLDSATRGNMIITGTPEDPILLNGDIVIDGDVVISGWIKGKGSIVATGNVYIPSDIQYVDGELDGNRTFGYAPDGTENALGLAAGGNVVVGDFYNSKDGLVTGLEDGGFSFVLSEMAIFNRGEWAKTQSVLPGAGESIDDPSSWTEANPDYAGSNYLPRYYGFDEGGTIPFHLDGVSFNSELGTWEGNEHVKSWDSCVLAYPDDSSDSLLYGADGNSDAVFSTVAPMGDWIETGFMRQWIDDAMAKHIDGDPIAVDAVLYSSNSIFGLVPKSGPADGQMITNGAILAADVGLLVGGGLQLNYDDRAHSLLTISGGGPLTVRRLFWIGSEGLE